MTDQELVIIIASVLMGENPNKSGKMLSEYVQLAEHRVRKIRAWQKDEELRNER